MNILHKGSLMTIKPEGQEQEQCLGYMINFAGHGIYEPAMGKVDVTKEEADEHNILLSEAQIKGLDENCNVGQGGNFYFTHNQVRTFIGVLVSDNIAFPTKRTIEFTRNGKVFTGRIPKNDDCIFIKRIH